MSVCKGMLLCRGMLLRISDKIELKVATRPSAVLFLHTPLGFVRFAGGMSLYKGMLLYRGMLLRISDEIELKVTRPSATLLQAHHQVLLAAPQGCYYTEGCYYIEGCYSGLVMALS